MFTEVKVTHSFAVVRRKSVKMHNPRCRLHTKKTLLSLFEQKERNFAANYRTALKKYRTFAVTI